jgi:hypothetical protein
MSDASRPKPIEMALLCLVAAGVTDPLDLGVAQRLVLMRARLGADPLHGPLVREAWNALLRAQERAEEAADRAFLNGLIDGTGDLLSEDTFPRMEPLFAKYGENTPMFALLEKAAIVFGDAVQELAGWVLAGVAINKARQGDNEDGNE